MKEMPKDFEAEWKKSIEAGHDTFEFLLDHTDGHGGRMVIALSSILASMEAHSPGIIEDITTGANLMIDKVAEVVSADMVKSILDVAGKKKH